MFTLSKYELNRLDSSWKFKKIRKISADVECIQFQYTTLYVTGIRYNVDQNIVIHYQLTYYNRWRLFMFCGTAEVGRGS